LKIQTSLTALAQSEAANEGENYAFKEALRAAEAAKIDSLVQELNDIITPQIDCTVCGNCCKTLMINVTQPEVEDVAEHLGITTNELKDKYIETSQQGDMMIVNTIPCHFLKGTMCSIYQHRFAECREFPGLHRPGFVNRLFATFMHYGRCPIIFNVIEHLKIKTGFIQAAD